MNSTHQPAAEKLISHLIQEDPELRDVVEEFVQGLGARVEELRQAHDQMDWDTLTTLAHRLKGAGGSYGYPDISQLCARIEQDARQQEAAEMQALINRLNDLTGAALSGLREPN